MNAPARHRLQQLRNDLASVRDRCMNWVGCSILYSSSEKDLCYEVWDRVSSNIPFLGEIFATLPMYVTEVHIDPFPPFSRGYPITNRCLRWIGTEEDILRFQEWGNEFRNAIGRFADSLPEYSVEDGYFGAIDTLMLWSRGMDSPSMEDRPVVELEIDKAQFALEKEKRTMVLFHVTEFGGGVIDFAEKVLDGLLGARQIVTMTLGGRTRVTITVDPVQNTATFNDETYPLDPVFAAILYQLAEAQGHPVTRKEMKEKSKLLALEERLDRKIEKLPKPFKQLIQSSKKGYFLAPAAVE